MTHIDREWLSSAEARQFDLFVSAAFGAADWLVLFVFPSTADEASVPQAQSVHKMIAMGAKMDGNLLYAAANAHHKAIASIYAKGVSAADYETVNALIGSLVASVPSQL